MLSESVETFRISLTEVRESERSTSHALLAPDRIKGLLYFHEYVSALGFSDFSYSYTLTLNNMAEEKERMFRDTDKLNSTVLLLAKSEEGTSTGVGGGDWRTIQLKLKLLEKLKVHLNSGELTSSEAARRLNFFMTLMIDFEKDDYFGGQSASTFAVANFFETGKEMRCRSKKGLRIAIRDSVADAFEDENNLEKLFQFILTVAGNPGYGQNAQCIRKR